MSKTSQSEFDQSVEQQFVDLGDAKEKTMGPPSQEFAEDNQQFPRKMVE